MNLAAALIALIVDRLFGYPQALVERIGHPVIWQGALISRLDAALNRTKHLSESRRINGVAALLALIVATLLPTLTLHWILSALPFGWLVEALLAAPFLAQKSLRDAVEAVANALKKSLAEGRAAVGNIVGRDTAELDEPEIARAAIESLAENASDGVIAPLFWFLIFGLPGIAVYKAVNTADSMIGHKSARYLRFGWASARFDDLLNLVPARLTALLFAAAAWLMPGADAEAAIKAARRDAPRHNSPNAGWPEAALAGALGFGLGGPRAYRGETLDLPHMGQGARDLGPADIGRAVDLYAYMLNLVFVLVCLAALISSIF